VSGLVAFSAADFSAYEPKKWGSNAYTLERIKVKEKCQQLAIAWSGAMRELTAHLSDEFPNIVNGKKVDSQWVYFSRSPEATHELARFLEKTELKPDKIFQLAPQDKHAILAVVIDETRIRAGLWAHAGAWVDRRNLAAKLIHPWEREKLKNALVDAPELMLGFEGETYPAAEWSLEALEALAVQLPEDERRFLLLREWSAEQAVTLGVALAADIEATLLQARATYDFATWSRDNDHIAVGEKIRKEKSEQRKNATGLRGGDRVRITGGLFAGKIGVVQGVDTKANVKVLVGAMAVTVPGADLSPVS
jgi:hypothetical protein